MATDTTSQSIGRERHRPPPRGLHIPVLGPLLVLCLLAAAFAAPTGAFSVTSTAYPWCTRNPSVPTYAYAVEEFVRSHNGSPPRGLGPQANAAWYTPDHYETFLEMHPWGCMPVLARGTSRVRGDSEPASA